MLQAPHKIQNPFFSFFRLPVCLLLFFFSFFFFFFFFFFLALFDNRLNLDYHALQFKTTEIKNHDLDFKNRLRT